VTRFLDITAQIVDGVSRSRDLVQKVTAWLEGSLRRVATSDGAARLFSRIEALMCRFAGAESSDVALRVLREPFQARLSDGHSLQLNLQRLQRLTSTQRLLARADRALKVLNVLLAFRDVHNDRSFRNWVNAAHASTELAVTSGRLQAALCRRFAITPTDLTRTLGIVGVGIALLDAAAAFEEGNNVAVLGHLLSASGGTLAVLSRGGGPGILAAILVVAGYAVVAFSLDDDEAYVLSFRQLRTEELARSLLREHQRSIRRASPGLHLRRAQHLGW
jgi:hypothetical protein